MLIISIMIISVLSAIGGININRMTKIVLIYAVMISISVTELSWPGIITGIGVYGGLYEIRPITQYIETYINIIGLIGMVIGGTGVTKRVTKGGQLRVVSEAEAGEAWPIIGLIICLGMSSLISSNEIISIIIGIEWQTLALYIIATIDRRSEASTGAGIKYYLLGALSSCIIGLGLSMIYGVSGVSNIEEWKIIIRIKEGSGHMSITIEWITVGLLFKLGAAPFHNWLADVIDGVSMGIGVWLGVISKISIIMILLIIYNGIMRGQGAPRVIIISIIISLIVGSLVGVVQTRVKPLLAYSSIAHGGYILIGIINDGITCIFYVIQYSMTIINIWMIIKAYGDVGVVRIERLSQIKGIPSTWVGVSITISILSSAGKYACLVKKGRVGECRCSTRD